MLGGAWFLVIAVLILGAIVQMVFRARITRYAKMPFSAGLTGKEVAEQMLREYGITGVKVVEGRGWLTDHYNPLTRTISLSPEVYHGRSVAAAAVAAHECGHAVQHARAYFPLQVRSALVPVVQLSSMIVHWVLLAGILFVEAFPQLLLAGIILFAITTLFSLITLPVEFDASRRAIRWLRTSGLVPVAELTAMKDALRWAAMTYVAAALGAIATLLYYIAIYLSARRN